MKNLEQALITDNARLVLEKRYLIKDENGKNTENVEEMFYRVASAVAAGDRSFADSVNIEALTDDFYKMMSKLEFLPNSPTLMNAGRPLGQLSACFVLPVEDSMEKIFDAIKQAALIHKSGGGTGFSFSRLRPVGSSVQTTGGVASGPISFMKVFNMATEAVKQGGTRRGANMGILRVDHPDILAFIDCKKDSNEINNFNISVGITEKFMEAVENDWQYDLFDPKGGEKTGSLKARLVFDKIVNNAWLNGEPGIIFLDRLNKDNVVPSQGDIESTNPCGEQPLLPYESCNLGSVNLVKMMKMTAEGAVLDYDKLKVTIHKAVHFLDNVIEINKYPLPEIDLTTKQTRKIGLGIMGFADILLLLNIAYNSQEAVDYAENLMQFVDMEAKNASADLAKSRGAFPLFAESIYPQDRPLRNATLTTIAPTGTLSIICGCSSGVEPVFAYAYIRNIMDNTEMLEVNPILSRVLQSKGLDNESILRKIADQGSLTGIDELPDDIKRIFVCSHDIDPIYHVKIQAAFQKYTDNAVSKTVNFAKEATQDDVDKVFCLAYQLGCKGVTIYRDGSRDNQVLNIGSVVKGSMENDGKIKPRPRPEVVYGITERMRIGCGNLYVTVNYDDKGICEVFTSTGKVGGCPSQSEAMARLVSIGLRSGIDLHEVISQLQGIRCPSTIRHEGMSCTSCPDAIARVLQRVNSILLEDNLKKNEQVVQKNTLGQMLSEQETSIYAKYCPECGAKLEHEGGCVSCRSCGFSKCG